MNLLFIYLLALIGFRYIKRITVATYLAIVFEYKIEFFLFVELILRFECALRLNIPMCIEIVAILLVSRNNFRWKLLWMIVWIIVIQVIFQIDFECFEAILSAVDYCILLRHKLAALIIFGRKAMLQIILLLKLRFLIIDQLLFLLLFMDGFIANSVVQILLRSFWIVSWNCLVSSKRTLGILVSNLQIHTVIFIPKESMVRFQFIFWWFWTIFWWQHLRCRAIRSLSLSTPLIQLFLLIWDLFRISALRFLVATFFGRILLILPLLLSSYTLCRH